MARHILAACVVCLLCADRLPCQQHFEFGNEPSINEFSAYDNINPKFHNEINMKTIPLNDKINTNNNNNNNIESNKKGLTIKDLENHPRLQPNYNSLDPVDSNLFDTRNPYRNQIPNNYYKLIKSDVKNLQRKRRHAGHHDEDEHNHMDISPITKEYIKKIFLSKGRKGSEMDLTLFEVMVQGLKLNKLKLYNENINNQTDSNENVDNCTSINELFEELYPEAKEKVLKEYEELVKTRPEVANKYQAADPEYKLTTNNIHQMCPILLYQMIKAEETDGCVDRALIKQIKTNPDSHQDFEEEEVETEEYEKDTFLIWMYSTVAVVFCGLLGLVGVAIIPFMNTKFYQQILSFLVALAVGTMTGDALLHLIPHSVLCATEEQMVRKGLVCVLGIIGFYAVENGFTLVSEYRKKIRRKNKANNANVRVVRTNGQPADDGTGEKLCKSKYSNDYCYEEVVMDNREENNHNQNNHQNNHQENHALTDGLNSNLDNDKPLTLSVIVREHDHTHHGHAHKHGHVHSPPATISAVAWMIILGDGLHNFTDGMAIGAAFSESIPGGFSTSLAVFCHELPHELGDFAILIKAGMTPKAAVAYNCLTAILSFFGMIFGIIFGENDEASRWMFSVAAGLFIYIALVDMMPEMTSAHKTAEQIILQLLGLIGGLMSMLLIALYEHELMNIFGGHNHSHGCDHGHGHSHGGGHGHAHGHGHSH